MNIRYLILALTTRCNLGCSYCYHGDLPAQDMSQATLRQGISLAASGAGPLHVQLTGGEPLLAPDLLCVAVEEILNLQRPTTIGLQTNGTLLTPQWAAFLRDHRVQVGLSLDGEPVINEKSRALTNDLLRGLGLLEACQTPFTVTTVATDFNASHLSGIPLLLAGYRQAKGFGLNILINKGRRLARPAGRNNFVSGVHELMTVLKQVNLRRTAPITFREMDSLAAALQGKRQAFCYACQGESLAIHPDGTYYPCGQTLGDTAFSSRTIENTAAGFRLLGHMRQTGPSCKNCGLQGRCPGDCPSRLYYNQGQPNLACDLYRAIYESL